MSKLKFWWAALFVGASATGAAQAVEDAQTAVTGTEEADDIEVVTPADATASVTLNEGGELSATATGVDALEGNDTIGGNSTINTEATAEAALVNATEESKGSATAVGIDAGDGDDQVSGALDITASATATGLYAGDISYQATQPPPKEIEVSVSAEASASGIEGGDGEDQIGNDGSFTLNADATSGGSASQFSATVQESVSIKATSEATASVTGISAGGDSDNIDNNGVMNNNATATSAALAVALVAPSDSGAPASEQKSSVKSEANSTATASATGINSADDSTEEESEDAFPWQLNGLRVTRHRSSTTTGSDDVVAISQTLTNTALATSGAGAGGVSNQVDASMEASATSEATAESTGISTGVGSDQVTNNGTLVSHATANAGALSVSIEVGTPSQAAPSPPPGELPEPATPSEDKENKSSSNTSVTASATAAGINTEGSGSEEVLDAYAEISDGELVIDYQQTTNTVAGNDVVENHGDIEAVASANAGSLGVGATQSSGGSSSSQSNSTATTSASGITTGGGNDTVTSDGVMVVSATSEASALNVGLAVGMPADDSGGEPPADTESDKVTTESSTIAEATAEAVGIQTSGESNSEASKHLVLNSIGLSVEIDESSVAAIDDDTVTNDNTMTVTSVASAGAADAGIALNAVGSVSSDASATATSSTLGITTGAGSDTITNNFLLTANATSSADALSVGITASKPTTGSGDEPDKTNVTVKAGATSEASSIGIDAEGSGHESSRHSSLSITANGLVASQTITENSQSGADRVTNAGGMNIDATATSGTLAAGFSIGAAGSVNADATSKADAVSGAISTGGGADIIDNTGVITSDATASARSLALSLVVSQPQQGSGGEPPTEEELEGEAAVMKGGSNAEATARATGIDAEGTTHSSSIEDNLDMGPDGLFTSRRVTTGSVGGNDHVTNGNSVSATANTSTLTGAIGLGVQSEGTASAEANATANASSGAVLTGAGSDTVDNTGALLASSTSSAGALSVSFSMSNERGAKSRSDARATSETQAVGIGTGSEEMSRVREADLTISSSGLELNYRDEQLADDGADTVTNDASVTAIADATSGALGAAITVDGSASTDVTATSKSRADAIDIGAGNDSLTSDGTLSASATSTSGALGIAFGREGGNEKTQGAVKVEATSIADSEATGIRADSGANSLTTGSLVIDDSGLEAHFALTTLAAGGNDTIINLGGVNATADSFAGTAGGSVAIDGAAKVEADATARSRATAIDGGAGNDSVRNEGAIVADANSQAYTIALAVGVNTAQGTASSKVDANSTANAFSTGISTDGAARNQSIAADLTINSSGIDLALAASSSAASGDDALTNLNSVSSRARADSGVAAVAVTVKGAANSSANSTATATSAALDTGGGADTVSNNSLLESAAEARAMTLSAAISTEGRAISNSGFMGAGTKAEARSAGITTRGMEETQSVEATANINFDDIGVTANFEYLTDSLSADGADSVTNSGEIIASGEATAPRINVAGTAKGVAVSVARVESESRVTGIDTGHLDDVIENNGVITATSSSTATLANIAVSGKGLAVAANAVWDGGTEATATAAGIDADGGENKSIRIDAEADEDLAKVVYTKEIEAASGDDSITNTETVNASATANADSLNVAVVAQTGLAVSVSTSTANADAFGLRGGDGDDEITNSGHLISNATATARTANVSVTNEGASIAADAVWDGGTEATARSIGIAGDGGDRTRTTTIAVGTDHTGRDRDSVLADGIDTISNTSTIDSTARSEALSVSVAMTGRGVSAATATSTATSVASAIDAGQGTSIDNVENAGALNVSSTAQATSASISITNQGLALAADAVWDGGTKANARGRGVDVGAGGETITNTGNIGASAEADTFATAAAVSMSGVAAATATSTSIADATAIDAGAGNDTDNITNTGTLIVSAESDAITATISATNNGVSIASDAVWDGGTTSNARARGIDVGAAADVIDNSGDMTVTSDGSTVALSAAVTVNGGAGAIATSTVDSSAVGIDAGDDNVIDEVANAGDITAIAEAQAITATLSFAMNGVALASDAGWNGGTHATTYSRGIKTGDGSDEIRNNGVVRAESESLAVSASVAISVNGVAGAIATATSDSSAIALDAGDGVGDDFVQNQGLVFADSTANSAAVAVSFTANGVAVAGADVWDGGVESHSAARGISVGAGTDRVENLEAIDSRSSSTATGVSFAVSVQGVAGAITTSTAVADAFGIDGAAGDDTVVNWGDILADSNANANSISVAGTMYGVSAAGNNAWDGGVTSTARAAAISGGTGTDIISNIGHLTSNADSLSPSVSVSFTVAGVAAAVSTATSNADARVLDGGDDRDILINTGALSANANSNAVSVNVALTGGGVAVAADSVWDGGTTANATAYGMSGGAGDDELSTTNSAGTGTVSANSHASTTSVSVSITGGGFAGSTSTSTANAISAAMDGGAGIDNIFNESAVTARAESDATSVSVAVTGSGVAAAVDAFWDGGTKANSSAAALRGGEGNDLVLNSGTASAIADSETLSATVAASFSPNFGVALASSASTSTADAFAIRGDAGDDQLENTGTLSATSDAYADGISVSFSTGGAAVAGAFDATTRGNASATGIAGGDGVDSLLNAANASITLDAATQVRDMSVAVTLAGVAQANSNAEVDTRGYGLDGGAGNDLLGNAGSITGTVSANAASTAAGGTISGGGLITANSTARAAGAGLAGGLGADDLSNTGNIDLDFSSNSRGLGVAVSGLGVALSQANAESIIDARGQSGDEGADLLVNTGSVVIDSNSSVTALSVSVAGIGGSGASANSVADTSTTGMSGGGDADLLLNDADALVDVHSGATLTSNAVAVSITGASSGEARTAAQVRGTGLSGGDGNDGVENRGDVVVTTAARSNATGFSFNLTGTSTSRAGTEADSLAVGIDGGAGDDIVLNSGSISVGPTAPGAWMAHLTADSQGVGVMSGADAQSATLARTQAAGIRGGEGADQMQNTGSIAVRSSAFTEATSGTINVFGSAEGGGKSGAFTSATGMDGAAGDDLLLSLTSLTVSAESRLQRNGTSFSFAGGGSVDSELVAETAATGLSGGDGADEIGAAGDIAISATSTLTSAGGGTTVFGSSTSAGKSGAVTQTSGIDAGAGDDIIDNQADITLTALSNLTLNNSSYTFGGSDNTSGTLAAITSGEAISGGSGADSIANAGHLILDISSTLTSTGNSSTTFGGAGDFVTSGGVTNAFGISGGDGDDVLENFTQGIIEIDASTNVNTQSWANVFAGSGPSTGAVLTGEVTSAGMSGGAGNDTVINRGSIHIDVDAALTSRGGASADLTATSGSSATGSATVFADAVGLAGGEGNDDLANLGSLTVLARGDADAGNDAGTGAASIVNGNTAGSKTRSTVNATGIDGGAGVNRVEIDGAVIVDAMSISYSLTTSSGANASFQSDGESVANSDARATAIGVTGQAGDDSILNLDNISVTATATTSKTPEFTFIIYTDIRGGDQNSNLEPPERIDEDALPPVADYDLSDVIYWENSPDDEKDPNNAGSDDGAHYQLRTVTVDPDGPGGNPPTNVRRWVWLEDGLYVPTEVTIDLPSFPSYAASNGGGFNGEGFSYATGVATAVARGYTLGAGNNAIENRGNLTVQATADATMYASADGDGVGDSFSSATATANALAVGIQVGDGNDDIFNSAVISVTATPTSQVRAQSSTDEICIWFFGWWCGSPGDSEGDAFTNVSSTALGVIAGNGNNRFVNDGTLTVTAGTGIRNDPNFGQFIASIDAEEDDTMQVTSSAVALGIQTGTGNDVIVNNGDISVTATGYNNVCGITGCIGLPTTTATVAATGIVTGDGNDEITNAGNISVLAQDTGVFCFGDACYSLPPPVPRVITASGVLTGTGNDIFRNTGTLRAEVNIASFISLTAPALDMGEGDDQLFLGDGSSIVGFVTLGEGNDTLDLRGTPIIAGVGGGAINVDAGNGIDTLVLNGLGIYGGQPVSIERAIKRETGTYTLGSLTTLNHIGIEDGTLRVNGDYNFSSTGTFETFFNVNGDSGVLSLAGDTTVAGSIEVERRGDTFIANGARFNVVHADGDIYGDFTTVLLPESRPLLSFELEREAQDVDVVAVVPSFRTVTSNPLYGQIAVDLDGIAPGSSGDLAELFGAIQGLEGGFDRALASFSPDTHLATSGSVLTNLREMTKTLQGHLSDSRVRYRFAPHARMPEASVSFSGGSGGFGVMRLSALPMSGIADLPPPPPPKSKDKGPRSQAWMLGIGADGSNRAIEGYSAFETDTKGFMFGADRRMGDNWMMGVMLGQAKTDIDSSDLASGEIETWLASAYATWFAENLYFETGLTIGKQDFVDTRLLDVAGDLRTASSKHDGKAWSAFMAGGLNMDYGNFSIEPYLSLNYFEASEDGFVETGADSISQLIGNRDGNAFFGEAGANFAYRQEWSRGLIDYHASFALTNDFGVDSDPLEYSYVGAPNSMFSIDARPVDDSATLYGVGISFIGDLSTFALDWRGLNDSYRKEKFFSARMSLRF